MVSDGLASVVMLGEEAYDVLKALHPAVLGRILLLDAGYDNRLFEEGTKDLKNCPLKKLINVQAYRLRQGAMNMLTLAGMTKCFTYPVIDIQESVDNVTSKSKVFNPDRKGGEKALW